MKKTLAFTLAEVLVVMGIIGVVAAITIPTLNNTTNEKEIVAKVNKSAAMITDSYGRARAKYGRYRKDWQRKDTLLGRLLENMQTTKICTGSDASCFPRPFKSYNGLQNLAGWGNSAILADGMSIYYSDCINYNMTCVEVQGAPSSLGYVLVDIDGPNKGYNTVGIDIFYFDLSPNGGLNTDDGSTMTALAEPVKLPHRTLASKMLETPAYAAFDGLVGGPVGGTEQAGWITGKNKFKLWRYTNYILASGKVDYLKK